MRRATANMAMIGWPDKPVGDGASGDSDATASWLATNRKNIGTIAITGQNAAVTATVEASGPVNASRPEVDFGLCAPEHYG